jgi:hypothetical protein
LMPKEMEAGPDTKALSMEEHQTCKTCPNCKKGTMIVISSFCPGQITSVLTPHIDSS